MSYQLLKSQKNQIFKIVADYKLDHSEFEWVPVQSSYSTKYISRLIHNPSGFYFEFDVGQYSLQSEYSPGRTLRIANSSDQSWDDRLKVVRTWLAQLSSEINAPDLWELANESKHLITTSYESDGEKNFTEKEVKQIKEKLDELNEYIIQTSNLHTKQYAYIGSRLDYLKSASERLTRKDWKMIFLGVLINIVFQFDFDSPTAHNIMMFANNLFTELYQKFLN